MCVNNTLSRRVDSGALVKEENARPSETACSPRWITPPCSDPKQSLPFFLRSFRSAYYLPCRPSDVLAHMAQNIRAPSLAAIRASAGFRTPWRSTHRTLLAVAFQQVPGRRVAIPADRAASMSCSPGARLSQAVHRSSRSTAATAAAIAIATIAVVATATRPVETATTAITKRLPGRSSRHEDGTGGVAAIVSGVLAEA